jgi:hypothetical protein
VWRWFRGNGGSDGIIRLLGQRHWQGGLGIVFVKAWKRGFCSRGFLIVVETGRYALS